MQFEGNHVGWRRVTGKRLSRGFQPILFKEGGWLFAWFYVSGFLRCRKAHCAWLGGDFFAFASIPFTTELSALGFDRDDDLDVQPNRKGGMAWSYLSGQSQNHFLL